MRFDIFTLFPAMFDGPFGDSIIARARSAGIIQVQMHNIRDFAEGKHQVTDDYPFGGGGGMVMKPDPIFRAVEAVLEMSPRRADHEQTETNDQDAGAALRLSLIHISEPTRPY